MTLTIEDLKVLKAPFKANEHEFLRGFAYITEFAISERIEQIDPAWQFEITALDTRPIAGTKNQVRVTCTAALTINGVTRYGVGQDVARETKAYSNKSTGELQQTEEANEPEKSAATDALKRAARLFGIGRYLLNLKGVKNEGDLKSWLDKHYGRATTAPENGSRTQPPENIAWTQEERRTWYTAVTAKGSVTKKHVFDALAITKGLGEWRGTMEAATKALDAHLKPQPANGAPPQDDVPF